MLPGLVISIADPAQSWQVGLLELKARQFDHLIRAHATGTAHPTTLYHTVLGIRSLARDKENTSVSQIVIPTVIGIALVNNQQTALGKLEPPAHGHIMIAPVSDRKRGTDHVLNTQIIGDAPGYFRKQQTPHPRPAMRGLLF